MYVPHAVGLADSMLISIDEQLRNGNPIFGWPGDPRLELHVGVLWDPKRKEVAEKKIEVWRHMEDGSDVCVTWFDCTLEAAAEVIPAMAQMRTDSPGHVSVLERIDRHNEALERKHLSEARAIADEARAHAEFAAKRAHLIDKV